MTATLPAEDLSWCRALDALLLIERANNSKERRYARDRLRVMAALADESASLATMLRHCLLALEATGRIVSIEGLQKTVDAARQRLAEPSGTVSLEANQDSAIRALHAAADSIRAGNLQSAHELIGRGLQALLATADNPAAA